MSRTWQAGPLTPGCSAGQQTPAGCRSWKFTSSAELRGHRVPACCQKVSVLFFLKASGTVGCCPEPQLPTCERVTGTHAPASSVLWARAQLICTGAELPKDTGGRWGSGWWLDLGHGFSVGRSGGQCPGRVLGESWAQLTSSDLRAEHPGTRREMGLTHMEPRRG